MEPRYCSPSCTLIALLLLPFAVSNPLSKRDCTTPTSYPGFDNGPGFIVQFKSESYTVDDHFKKIGQKFTVDALPGIGYTANLTQAQISTACGDPEVHEVAHDVYLPWLDASTNLSSFESNIGPRASQPKVGYGLTYLSQTQKHPPDDTYHFLESSGKDVDVYIIDSGINKIKAFGERVVWEKDYVDRGFRDTLDHGTKVASFVGSDKYGSAKQPTLYAYKVDTITGIPLLGLVVKAFGEIVVANRMRKSKPGYKGAVINLSNKTPPSTGLQAAVERAEGNGIVIVTGAGNERLDAANAEGVCKWDDSVICVGAIDKDYTMARWGEDAGTNFGRRLTLFAPGKDLTGFDKDGAERSDLEGTSFASPYVAGIVATYFGVEGPKMNLARAKELLKKNAEQGVLEGSLRDSPNILANNGFQKAKGLPYLGAPSPTESITSTASPSPTPSTAPAAQPNPSDTCADWYRGAGDEYYMQGKNFDPAKLGPYGRNLLTALRHCGVVSDWKFEFFPPNSDYDWWSKGFLPIGTRSCIGSAPVSVGGPSADGCVGAG